MQRQTVGLLLVAVALATLGPRQAEAKITDAELRKDERVFVPLDEPFGFGVDGRINITLSDFLVRPLYDPKTKEVSHPQLSRMGILITTPYGELQIQDQIKEGVCPLDSEEQVTLFTFDVIDHDGAATEQDYILFDLLEDYQGGEFVMFFANCEANTAVDFKITLALFNQKGAKSDFLAVGQDMLPTLYFVSCRRPSHGLLLVHTSLELCLAHTCMRPAAAGHVSPLPRCQPTALQFELCIVCRLPVQITFLFFFGMVVSWVHTVVKASTHAHKIHYLMAALVIFKSLTLLSQAGMYHMIGLYGHPEGWNIAFVSRQGDSFENGRWMGRAAVHSTLPPLMPRASASAKKNLEICPPLPIPPPAHAPTILPSPAIKRPLNLLN